MRRNLVLAAAAGTIAILLVAVVGYV